MSEKLNDKEVKGNKILQRLKNSFVTGLFVSAPIFITLGIFYYVLAQLDSLLGGIFSYFIALPGGRRIPGLGLVALALLILFFGELTRRYIGKRLIRITENIFTRIPILRVIYNALKQIGTYIMATRQKAFFRRVVLVQWPNKYTHILGFLTEESYDQKGEDDKIAVYVPTAPNPTSGYLLYVEKSKIQTTDISIEEGMKIIISAGIVQYPTTAPIMAANPSSDAEPPSADESV